MKTKKKGIIAACIIILATVILFLIFSPFIRSGVNSLSAKKYFSEDLENIDNVKLIANCEKVDSADVSVAGVKEAVRLGADGVVVDLCFKKDGTPVLCSDYSLCESSETVESLFKAMQEDTLKDTLVYLNIVQLSDMSQLNVIASDYNVLDRVFIVGIDEEHYGMVTKDDTNIPFYIDYKLTAEDKKNISDDKFASPGYIEEYGASGLIIDKGSVSTDVSSAFNDLGITVIYGIFNSETSVCEALINGAENVYVSDIKSTKTMLDGWVESMQQRNESSIEQSLNALSTSEASK